MSFNILAPLDFSDLTFRQLGAVKAFCAGDKCHVVLLHVHNPSPGYMGVSEPSDDFNVSEERRQLDLALRNLDALLGPGSGVSTEGVLLQGESVPRILQQAEEMAANMIVIGTHGHGAVYNILVGSVARNILTKSTVPVLLVPPKNENPNAPFSSVTVGVDFGKDTEELVQVAAAVARRLGASLHLHHVQKHPNPTVEGLAAEYVSPELRRSLLARANERLREIAEGLEGGDGEPVHTESHLGAVAVEILNASRARENDLVVVGSHGHGLAYDMFMGPSTQSVVQHSERPVLVIPLRKHQPFAFAPKADE